MVDHRDRAARLGAALGLAAVLGACTGGGGSPAPSGPAAATTSPTVAISIPTGTALAAATTTPPSRSPGTTVHPAASPGQVPAAPPTAVLGGLTGDSSANGELGTYFWADVGTDAPWIVGNLAGTAGRGAPLHITFGGARPGTWTAAWAKVVQGSAGSPVGASTGTGDVALSAPGSGGDWTLRVTAVFGPTANATYYWRLTVAP